jgi:hypothetical protein
MDKIVVFLSVMMMLIPRSDLQAQFERTAGKIVTDKKPGGIIEAYHLEGSDLMEGSFFINEDWYIGNVSTTDGSIFKNVPMKYNLRDDLLHILDTTNSTRVISSHRINHFEWFNFKDKRNNRFINARGYRIEGVPLTGIAEIFVKGETSLIIYRRLEIQKAMYSVIHDAGQKNDEFIINEFYYIQRGDELFRVKNKKSLDGLFAGQEEAMKSFIRDNHLSLKNVDHLSRIVSHYNSLQRN